MVVASPRKDLRLLPALLRQPRSPGGVTWGKLTLSGATKDELTSVVPSPTHRLTVWERDPTCEGL